MSSNRCETFCRQVCAFVRFSPDHDAITAELTAHLEDHQDALLELHPDLTPEEAEAAAVLAMGDPEELGRALNESHSPLLGWFQIWFQAVVWLLSAIIIIFCLFHLPGTLENLTGKPDSVSSDPALYFERHVHPDNLVAQYETNAVYQDPPYTYTIEQVGIENYSGARYVDCILQVTQSNPWLRCPAFGYDLWAEDDVGNRYPSPREWQALDETVFSRVQVSTPMGDFPFATHYCLTVTNVDPAASQLTFRFDRYGEVRLSLTVPLKGGEADG